ncbi:PREDICTED: prion-like-(Q/N-rich) domain-bearing protein 25 isoform X2 [Eufriesea mexicana]|nr:PREDICTED: prion-like-(Q/N-rich) domain-bearing protein 25 isoform X2 [Eufriesea mexicana]
MLALASTKKCLYLLLIVVTLNRTVNSQFDPPIPCQSLQNCTDVSNTLKAVSCQNGFCTCKYDGEIRNCSSMNILHHNSDKSTGISIFRNCKVNQDCRANNTICNTTVGHCACQEHYILSSNKRACLKKAEALDFPCVEDKQCLGFLSNTTCQNGQCSCMPGYHHTRNACYRMIGIGERCSQSEECAHVHGAICTDEGVCDCAEKTVINGERKECLSVASEILDSCVEDIQCTMSFPNALCIDRTCQCHNRYHFEPEMRRCFIDKSFGENCGNKYECYQVEKENVTEKALACEENICVCAENYAREEDRCVNEGSRFPVPVLLVILATIACVAFSRQN